MVAILLMLLATAGIVIFFIKTGKAGKSSAAEIVLSRAWLNRFARQELEEKKLDYLRAYDKYHVDPEKKARKKVREWDKQIEEFRKKEEKYFSGSVFAFADYISLFGYQFLVDLKLDSNNEILKKLTASCEQSGFIELERSQETSGKRNSAIYAYYLLAYMTSFVWIGLILMCITGTVMIAAGNEMTGVALPMLGAFGIMALLGYIPYDGLNSRTKRRQEDLNREFPDAVSKITLLVAAGMNMTRAIEQTAQSGNSLIYQELRLVVKEMDRSSTLQGAFMRMQGRCSNKYLDKMITVVSKSYASGNANLADDLKTINDECWLDKKHNARRMSEAVQNKLFIPTMLMFIGILVVIVVPAMAGFNL